MELRTQRKENGISSAEVVPIKPHAPRQVVIWTRPAADFAATVFMAPTPGPFCNVLANQSNRFLSFGGLSCLLYKSLYLTREHTWRTLDAEDFFGDHPFHDEEELPEKVESNGSKR